MRIRNLFLILLVITVCVSLFACAKDNNSGDTANTESNINSEIISDIDTDTEKESDTDTVTESEQADTPKTITIGDVNISDFTIVASSDDAEASTLAEYFAENVKALTGIEMTVVDSSENVVNAVAIGNSDIYPGFNVGADEFIIKIKDGSLYIIYASGSSPYQAVTAVINDELFAAEDNGDGLYSISSDFEFNGECRAYVIGDNEFNPFE